MSAIKLTTKQKKNYENHQHICPQEHSNGSLSQRTAVRQEAINHAASPVEPEQTSLPSVQNRKPMKALLDNMSTEIPSSLLSEFQTWEAGFDACTQFEQTGIAVLCPYVNKQAALWRQGYEASRRVTEIGREAA